MVFGKFTGNGEYPSGRTYTLHSPGENRARFTSVVTTGLCLLGDDFLNCTEEARVRAQSIVKNEEINRIGKIGKSFRPIVNDYWGTGQADAFMHRVADKDTKIYPNPCHDELYINKLNNENNCDYDVYSIAGEKLISLDDFGGDVIDVNPLAPGRYILVSTDTVTRNRFVASFIKE